MSRHLLQITATSTLVIFAGLNTGCQTSRYKDFQNVTEGMDKGQVIDAAGSPNRSDRWRGKDRWTYVLYPDRVKSTAEIREVHFENGLVVYRGKPVPPEVSAEEQDRTNEESNLALERRTQAEIEAARAANRRAGQNGSSADEARRKAPVYESVD